MNITGTSTYVKIEFEGKVVKVTGEFIVGGFVALKSSMNSWEEPYQGEEFEVEIRNRIVEEVIEYCKNKDFKVEFE